MLIKLIKACLVLVGIAALSLWLAGCNHLDQPGHPEPKLQPVDAVVELTTDAQGRASIRLEQLGISRRAVFTLNASGFLYGKIVLTSDSTLGYQATSQENWQADSGIIHACQGGVCGDRRVKVVNTDFVPQQTCDYMGLVKMQNVADRASFTFRNLKGLEEAGARLDTVWGMFHQATIDNIDSTTLTYYSLGGPANGVYLGYDQLYYRIRRPGGGCKTGLIRITLPDSCSEPQARPDRISFSGPDILIQHTDLVQNDSSCTNEHPTNPIVRLNYRPYTLNPSLRIRAKWGILVDTVPNGGQPHFYYRRTHPAATGDTLTYYLENGKDGRVTLSNIFLRFN